jgi:hypothetical protein
LSAEFFDLLRRPGGGFGVLPKTGRRKGQQQRRAMEAVSLSIMGEIVALKRTYLCLSDPVMVLEAVTSFT